MSSDTPSGDARPPATARTAAGSLWGAVVAFVLPTVAVAGLLTVLLIVRGEIAGAALAAVAGAGAVATARKVRAIDGTVGAELRRIETVGGVSEPSGDVGSRLARAVEATQRRIDATEAAHERVMQRGTSDIFAALAGRTAALADDHVALVRDLEQTCLDQEMLGRLYDLDRSASRLRGAAMTSRALGGPLEPLAAPVAVDAVVDAARAALGGDSTVVGVLDEAAITADAANDVILLTAAVIEKVANLSPSSRASVDGWMRSDDYTLVVAAADVVLDDAERAALVAALSAAPALGRAPHPFAFSIAATLAERHGVQLVVMDGVEGLAIAVYLPLTAIEADAAAVDGAALERRPFLMAGGRTLPSTYVDPHLQVMRTTRSDGTDGVPREARPLLELLERPMTPIDLADETGLPVGVVLVLVGDLIERGDVIVHRTARSVAGASLLEQALNGANTA